LEIKTSVKIGNYPWKVEAQNWDVGTGEREKGTSAALGKTWKKDR